MVELKANDQNEKATTEICSTPRESVAPRRKLRPAIQAAMSRRTFKKRTCEQLETILVEDLKVDFILRSFSDVMPMKLQQEKVSYVSNEDKATTGISEDGTSSVVKIDGSRKCIVDPQKDIEVEAEAETEMQKKEKNKLVGEWIEEDQKSQMDLGSSDIEKRLESLMAKRRAKKMFSMVLERAHVNSQVNDLQAHIAPILTERNNSDANGAQPGSAPSLLLAKNPFDIPYDPSEEKPILTGDGFEDEFCIAHPKDIHFCRHESFAYGTSFPTRRVPDPPFKSKFSVFTNPIESVGPGLPKLRRPTDVREDVKHVFEQSSQETELSREEQLQNVQSSLQEEANILAKKINASSTSLEPEVATKDQELDSKQEERPNSSSAESTLSKGDEPEVSLDLIEDDNDETSSSSSIEESTDLAVDVSGAVKNESFRNSVKKVLSVIQKNRGTPPLYPSSTSDPSNNSNPRSVTKMEERSFYTRPTHHLSYSIASDMQVEVSDGPNSPTDVESLVFDRDDDDQDEDDSDENSEGTSAEPFLLDEFGTRSKSQIVNYPTIGSSEGDQQNMYNSQDTNGKSTNADLSTLDPIDDKHEQCVTQDIDFGSIQSSCGSASPVTHQSLVVQQIPRNTSPFSTERLQDNTPMVGSASTSTEQNIDTYIHLPSHDLLREDRDHSLQASIPMSMESEVVGQPDVLDLSSSPRSVLQESIGMDDEASTNSEHNIETNSLLGPISQSITVNHGSNVASSSSPKSVLPDRIEVHEFDNDHKDEVESSSLSDAPQEDQQIETPPSSFKVPLDEMALRSGESIHSNVEPFDGVLVSSIPLHDLPLVEDGLSQEASTLLDKEDHNEEKL